MTCANAGQMTSISSPCSPTINSISKAEEILGPSETGGGSSQSKGFITCLGTSRLKKKLSALSIKIMNPECERARSHKSAGDEEHAKVASPKARTVANGSVTSFNGRSLHTYRSSSTLQSHPDPELSPRAISQQNSASKVRDMPIRKGCSPVTSPVHQPVFRDFAMPIRWKSHGAKKEPELDQRRPTHIDFSTLFPKPQSPNDVSLSPYDTTASPSLLSAASDIEPPHSPSRRTWLRWKTSTTTSQLKSPSTRLRLEMNDMVSGSGNAAMGGTAGPKQREDVENWLDDAELDDDFDTMGEKSTLGMFVKDSRPSPKGSGASTDQSSSSVKTLTSQITVSGPYYRLQSVLSHESLPPAAKAKASFPLSQPRQRSDSNRFSKIPYSDLNIQSVLAFSSSDEDSDRESKHERRRSPRSLRGIALTVSTTQDMVASHTKSNPYPPYSSASESPSQPRNFAKPFRHSPSNSKALGKSFFQQPSSVHWDVIPNIDRQAPQSALSLSKPNTLASSGSLHQVAHSNSSSVSFPEDMPSSRPSRMMAVSAEEETLLSAMRSKRASMRKAILAEGLTYAIGHGLAAPRPQTADGDKRASSFFEPDMNDFPNPPGAALRLSKAAVSSEDLRLLHFDVEDANKDMKAETQPNIGVEKTMTMRQHSTRATSTSQPPSRLGSTASASDLVTSPTTSHGAPLTPPPTVYVADSDGFDTFASDGQAAADFGHSRKRTLSSVLFLDGVEERAREREQEEELVGWAVGERV